MMPMTINPLEHPICLEYPIWIQHTSWAEHTPFAMFIVSALRTEGSRGVGRLSRLFLFHVLSGGEEVGP